jgi:hypothetical protein
MAAHLPVAVLQNAAGVRQVTGVHPEGIPVLRMEEVHPMEEVRVEEIPANHVHHADQNHAAHLPVAVPADQALEAAAAADPANPAAVKKPTHHRLK